MPIPDSERRKCTKCTTKSTLKPKRAIKDGLCVKCYREENNGAYPYPSYAYKKQPQKEPARVTEKQLPIRSESLNKHIVSLFCLAQREINRGFESYICEGTVDIVSMDHIKSAVGRISQLHVPEPKSALQILREVEG